MNFFFDRCVPVGLCRAVKGLEEGSCSIVYLDERFPKGTADPVWLNALASWDEKPVIISGDTRILKRPDELRALVALNLPFVCLGPGWTKLGIDEFTWKFFKVWPEIKKAACGCREPAAFEVACGGSLKVEVKSTIKNLAK